MTTGRGMKGGERKEGRKRKGEEEERRRKRNDIRNGEGGREMGKRGKLEGGRG